MYQPSFKGCWTLIDRAKHHRDAIDEYIRKTFSQKTNLAEIRADRDPGIDYHSFRIKSAPDLSEFQEQVSAMTGNVIANLRSTLDHLVWQLACRHTNGNPKLPRGA
jgi:hypothetical protein